MSSPARSSLQLTGGTRLSYVTAGSEQRPAVLLIHGFPSSANTFRDILAPLAEVAFVVAPDMPGYGRSEVLPATTFDKVAAAIAELIEQLNIRDRYIYVHDYGAPVAFRLAMDQPERVRGLIIQNANAHRTGFGPQWRDTIEFWAQPTPENEAAATAHLTFEGVRDQYIAGVPEEVARTISPAVWEEDGAPYRRQSGSRPSVRCSPTTATTLRSSTRSQTICARDSRQRSWSGGGTTFSLSSRKPCPGWRICRAWKLTSRTAVTSCWKRTRPLLAS
jgi:pimeloyl-ACP methyl ester carboxylesterase